MNNDARRYESQVDLSAKNTSHAQLVMLTGRNKRVLEVGPATGYVTEVLRRRGCQVTAVENDPAAAEVAEKFCERIIVGDIEEIDFPQTFGEEQFDVVMFGDVLEHLVDPKGALEKVRPLLRAGGCVVASIPNVAHASVRVMLLDGKFVYTEKGLLDHTHLRFFTKSGIETLFEEAGYRIRVWRRTSTDTLQDPFAEELSLGESQLPPHLVEALRQDPEALTYQFVVRAYPQRVQRLNKRGSQRLPDLTNGVGSALEALWDLERVFAQKDRDIAHMEAGLAEKDALVAEKEILIASTEATLAETEQQLREVQQQFQTARSALGYRLLERTRAVINRAVPPRTRRRAILGPFRQGLRLILTEGWGAFLRRGVQVWRWAPRLIRRARLAASVGSLDEQYQLWLQAHALTPAQIRRITKEALEFSYRPKVSIIMPVYNSDPAWLREAIESVRGQLYDDWELCIADDASSEPAVRELLQEYEGDERIKIVYLKENQGISGASNAALTLATGEYVGFLDHDDELRPDALYEVVKLLNERPELDFIYSDEDKLDEKGNLVSPFFKPDWSPDLLLSTNYVPHFAVYRKTVLDEVGGLRSGCDFSQDYDLALRVTEQTELIGHIPLPLYTWRMVPGSAASDRNAKPRSAEAGKRALTDAMQRRGIEAAVEDGPFNNTYRVRYLIREQPLVSIVIPTRDRVNLLQSCIASIEKKSKYSNYEIIIVDNDSREEATRNYLERSPHRCLPYPGEFRYGAMMNFAVREARGEYVTFLNNDTEVIADEWIEAMLEHAQRPEVAAVGARLLYPSGSLQHEGVVIGVGGGSCLNVDTRDYFGLGRLVRNVSALTAACMMVRRQVFEALGRFDEGLKVAFHDVDYCLRAREKGYLIVYTPYAVLIHYEGASRGSYHPQEDELSFRQRWGQPGQYRDPYYNPNLSHRLPFTVKVD